MTSRSCLRGNRGLLSKSGFVGDQIAVNLYDISLRAKAAKETRSAVLYLNEMLCRAADLDRVIVRGRDGKMRAKRERVFYFVRPSVRRAREVAGKPITRKHNVDRRLVGYRKLDLHITSIV